MAPTWLPLGTLRPSDVSNMFPNNAYSRGAQVARTRTARTLSAVTTSRRERHVPVRALRFVLILSCLAWWEAVPSASCAVAAAKVTGHQQETLACGAASGALRLRRPSAAGTAQMTATRLIQGSTHPAKHNWLL